MSHTFSVIGDIFCIYVEAKHIQQHLKSMLVSIFSTMKLGVHIITSFFCNSYLVSFIFTEAFPSNSNSTTYISNWIA